MWNLRSTIYELFKKIRDMKLIIREKNIIRKKNEMLCKRNETIREKIRAKIEMIRENISSKKKFESWKNLLFFQKKKIFNFRNKKMLDKTIWTLFRKNEIIFRKTSNSFKRIRDELITRTKRLIESHI